MKKIILTVGVVVSVAVLHAAQVKWSITNITAPDSSSALTTGTIAYFMDANTYSEFATLSNVAKVEYAEKNNTYSAYSATYKGATRVLENSGDYSKGTSVSGYLVLFDTAKASEAGYLAYTAVMSGTMPESGATLPLAFGKFSDAMAAEGSSGGWVAIPEPTSGLLMLLGMAGLALKRKHV